MSVPASVPCPRVGRVGHGPCLDPVRGVLHRLVRLKVKPRPFYKCLHHLPLGRLPGQTFVEGLLETG